MLLGLYNGKSICNDEILNFVQNDKIGWPEFCSPAAVGRTLLCRLMSANS